MQNPGQYSPQTNKIDQQSEKLWFFNLWGRNSDVWRIEWQVRKETLKRFGIITFADLHNQQGDLLRYLATEHETLRVRTRDSNRSRWPLHPLWKDVQAQVHEFNQQGIHRVMDEPALLGERLTRYMISVYGYLKPIAAVRSLQQHRAEPVILDETLWDLVSLIKNVHDPLTWRNDVEKRMNEIRLGK